MKGRITDLIIILLLLTAIGISTFTIIKYSHYKLVAGVYYIDRDTAMIDMSKDYSDVMETCAHEFEHHKYNEEHWDKFIEYDLETLEEVK